MTALLALIPSSPKTDDPAEPVWVVLIAIAILISAIVTFRKMRG